MRDGVRIEPQPLKEVHMYCFDQKQRASHEATSKIEPQCHAWQNHPAAAPSHSLRPGYGRADSTRFGHPFLQRSFSSGAQPAFTLGPSDDAYEREAEKVGSQVARMRDARPGASAAISRVPASPLQRMCAQCEEEKREEGKGGPPGAVIEGHLAAGIQALRGRGAPLPASERSFFEPRFGHDFARVRLHAGSHADSLARSLEARAFTVGQDIVLGESEYAPASPEGRQVLAHELVHTVQQSGEADRIQRLTITRHSFSKGTCHERNVQWVFSLDRPASADGYIVQHIEMGDFINECPNVQAGPPNIKQSFWEAWKLRKGQKVDWTTTRDKWTDGSTHPPLPNTSGVDFANGEVKFFLQSTTGDLGDFGVAPSNAASGWSPGGVTTSGALPSTASQPSWWSGSPAEGPAKRSIWADWNCCDADAKKHSYNLKATP
jgi:hypothetical protein